MKLTKHVAFIAAVLVGVLLVTGCPTPTPSGGPQSITARSMIDELGNNLSAGGYTAERVAVVTSGATTAVESDPEATLESKDLYLTMPIITGGAIASLDNAQFTGDTVKLLATEAILSSLTSSLKGRNVYSATFEARAIDPNADVMRAILAGITKAAIENLATTGVSDVNAAAGSVVGTLVENMDDAGVTDGYVGEAAGDLVSAAVDALGAGAEAEAVKIITSTAVETLAMVDIDGFEADDIPEAVGAIAEGVAEVLPNEDLISSATEGIAEAAVIITSDPAVMAKIVEETAAGATEGLGMNDDIAIEAGIGDVAQDTIAGFTNAGASVTGDLQTIVVVAASEGAANVGDAALNDASDIETALEDGTGLDVTTTDIDAGIAQAANIPPVISAVSDRSVESDNILAIVVTATDEDGDDLTYAWAISSEPANDGSLGAVTDQSSVEFTGTTIGSYVLRVEVSDWKSGVKIDTVIRLINVEVTPSTAMTSRARIDYAISLMMGIADPQDTDYNNAMDQLSQVPTDTGDELMNIEKVFWHGFCHEGLNNQETARDRYSTAISLAQTAMDGGNAAAFEWKARAANRRAWTLYNIDGDTDAAIAQELTITNDTAAIAAADGEWVAGAYEHLQAFYMMKDDWPNAASAASEVDNHSPAPVNLLWRNFRNAETTWQYNGGSPDPASASTAYLALGRAVRDGTAPYDGLSASEKYWGLRWIYACAGWSLNDASSDNAATISGYYDEALAIGGAPAWWEAFFETERGWRYKQASDNAGNESYYPTAEAAFLTGAAAGPHAEADKALRALAYLYKDWTGYEAQTLAAFQNAFDNASDPERKLENGINYGEYLMWDKDDNDAAITQFNAVLSLNTNDYSMYEAKARMRLGHAWMRKGWDADDGVGTDHIGFFNSAIGVLDDISLSDVGKDTWIYYEAIGDRGQALVKVGRSSEALSLLNANLSGAPEGNNKERMQHALGEIYFDMGREDRDNGRDDDAITNFNLAITEFGKVIYVDNGFWKAFAELQAGDSYRHIGWTKENQYYNGNESDASLLTDSKTAFGSAITELEKVDHLTTYADLVGDSDWLFWNAYRQRIEAHGERNEAGDLSAIQTLVASADTIPGYEGGTDILDIQQSLADAYRNIADDWDWELWDSTIQADYVAALSANQDLIDASTAQSDPNDGAYKAWGYRERSRLYLDMIRRIRDSIRDDAVNLYTGATKSDYEAYVSAGIAAADAGIAITSPDNGRHAATSQVTKAEIYAEQSRMIWDSTADWGTDTTAHAAVYTAIDNGLTAAEAVLTGIDDDTWPGAENWVYSVAIEVLGDGHGTLLEEAGVFGGAFTSVDSAAAADLYNRNYELAIEGLTGTMDLDRLGRFLQNLGCAVAFTIENMQTYNFTMDITGYGSNPADWSVHAAYAETYLDMVINPSGSFADVDDGWLSAETVFSRGELYTRWAYALDAEGDYANAKTYFEGAKADFQAIADNPDFDGDWREDSALNDYIPEIDDILTNDSNYSGL